MIANVSYGYTAAAFSGRMPMAELADSIVQSGRQTLINAIDLIQSHPEWSLFYLVMCSLLLSQESRSRIR